MQQKWRPSLHPVVPADDQYRHRMSGNRWVRKNRRAAAVLITWYVEGGKYAPEEDVRLAN
jgi:hypothetical protein